MSIPPLSQGYTKMHTDALRNLVAYHLSGSEFAICLQLLRLHAGYGKDEIALGEHFLCKTTGYHKNRISVAINRLMRHNVIIRTRNPWIGHPAYYQFNFDVSQWKCKRFGMPLDDEKETQFQRHAEMCNMDTQYPA